MIAAQWWEWVVVEGALLLLGRVMIVCVSWLPMRSVYGKRKKR